METTAQQQLQLFKSPEEAFERRGYANAMSEIRDFLENLYKGSKQQQEVPSIVDDDLNPIGKGVSPNGSGSSRERDYSY